jgi:hypothetical protein
MVLLDLHQLDSVHIDGEMTAGSFCSIGEGQPLAHSGGELFADEFRNPTKSCFLSS